MSFPADPEPRTPGVPYPAVRYQGSTGQATTWMRPHDAPREVNNASGGGAAYLASSTATGGAFGLYRWDMGPDAGGPGPHFHRTITESFYVLTGTVALYDGRQWRDGVAGDFMHVPVGGIHAFRNASGEPASMLLLFTPGAPREAYFETLADAARRAAMNEEELAEFYLFHDNHWL